MPPDQYPAIPSKGAICLADDELASRFMLRNVLETWGYQVEECSDGNEAFACLSRVDGPRLALLDWSMPGMDGIQVCQRLRQEHPSLKYYLILVTGRSEDTDVQTALRSGGDDFVSKPWSELVLQARIEVGFRTIAMHRTIDEYASRMQALADSRAAQLVHSDRLALLGVLAASVAHEINNPASFLAVNLQTIEDLWPSVEASVAGPVSTLHKSRADSMVQEMPSILREMKDGLARIRQITSELRSFSRTGASCVRSVDAVQALQKAMRMCSVRVKNTIDIRVDLPPSLPGAMADEGKLIQVFANLIMNANDAMEDSAVRRLYIDSIVSPSHCELRFRDTGPGVPADRIDSLFQPFFTTKPVGKGTGLGLHISRGIMEEFGGVLMHDVPVEGGARFTARLPLATGAGS
jgi:C4-dicarboxylate-specific signal transduction histidine kinase